MALGKTDGRVLAGLFKMDALVDEVSRNITFSYKLRAGSKGDSRGTYCARIAGIPDSIAEAGEQASTSFVQTFEQRLEATEFCALSKGLTFDGEQALLAQQQL